MNTVIVRFTARYMTPVIAALALYLLVRGHNAPGGGFIAALLAGAAAILRYAAKDFSEVGTLGGLRFDQLIAAGLALAVGVGLAGVALGGEFLEGAIWKKTLPLLGELKVTASFAFDVGVFLIVLGTIAAIRHIGEGSK